MWTTLWILAAPAPTAEPAPPPAPLTFRTTLDRAPAAPCAGPLRPGDQPCAVAFSLGTAAAITTLDLLLPVERRLTGIAIGAPIAGPRRPGIPGTSGPWVTGFSPDPTFVGLGRFDMRAR